MRRAQGSTPTSGRSRSRILPALAVRCHLALVRACPEGEPCVATSPLMETDLWQNAACSWPARCFTIWSRAILSKQAVSTSVGPRLGGSNSHSLSYSAFKTCMLCKRSVQSSLSVHAGLSSRQSRSNSHSRQSTCDGADTRAFYWLQTPYSRVRRWRGVPHRQFDQLDVWGWVLTRGRRRHRRRRLRRPLWPGPVARPRASAVWLRCSGRRRLR